MQAELGRQPMQHFVCEAGTLDAARCLHDQGMPLDVADREGDQPMHFACAKGHLAVARWLHEQGAPLDVADRASEQPNYKACVAGHLDVARWLHEQGEPLDVADSSGMQPMHYACIKGHLDVAQWLHEQGAPLDVADSSGRHPLHYACIKGQLDVSCWLHEQGVPLDVVDHQGRTPLALAKRHSKRHGHHAIIAWLSAPERAVEQAAEAAAQRLLEEEAAEAAAAAGPSSKRKGKAKASGKSKAVPTSKQLSGAGSSSDPPPSTTPLQADSDAADAALRAAVEAADLAALKATINETANTASASLLHEARSLRERLKDREVKARKQARAREQREAPARQALQALWDAEAADTITLRSAVAQAEALVLDFSEILFDALAAANARLMEEEERLAHSRRAAAKTRHVEEHALRFEVSSHALGHPNRALSSVCVCPLHCAHRRCQSTKSATQPQRPLPLHRSRWTIAPASSALISTSRMRWFPAATSACVDRAAIGWWDLPAPSAAPT